MTANNDIVNTTNNTMASFYKEVIDLQNKNDFVSILIYNPQNEDEFTKLNITVYIKKVCKCDVKFVYEPSYTKYYCVNIIRLIHENGVSSILNNIVMHNSFQGIVNYIKTISSKVQNTEFITI